MSATSASVVACVNALASSCRRLSGWSPGTLEHERPGTKQDPCAAPPEQVALADLGCGFCDVGRDSLHPPLPDLRRCARLRSARPKREAHIRHDGGSLCPVCVRPGNAARHGQGQHLVGHLLGSSAQRSARGCGAGLSEPGSVLAVCRDRCHTHRPDRAVRPVLLRLDLPGDLALRTQHEPRRGTAPGWTPYW